MNDWLKFSDDELSDYLNRELEYTNKGQLKSNTTNLITVLVNPLFCKEEKNRKKMRSENGMTI